jgi:hypothetical protein
MRQEPDLHAIRRSLELVGRLSDGIIQVGPFGLGLEALFDWIPGVGEVYGFGAGAFIIVQGVRAGVPVPTLVLAGALMSARTLISAVPLAGPLAADILTLLRRQPADSRHRPHTGGAGRSIAPRLAPAALAQPRTGVLRLIEARHAAAGRSRSAPPAALSSSPDPSSVRRPAR